MNDRFRNAEMTSDLAKSHAPGKAKTPDLCNQNIGGFLLAGALQKLIDTSGALVCLPGKDAFDRSVIDIKFTSQSEGGLARSIAVGDSKNVCVGEPAPPMDVAVYKLGTGAAIHNGMPNVLYPGAPFKIFDTIVGLVEILMVHLLVIFWRANKRSSNEAVYAGALRLPSPIKSDMQIPALVSVGFEDLAFSIADIAR